MSQTISNKKLIDLITMLHDVLKKHFILCAILLVPVISFAQTISSVTGTISNNESIVISGSGFGSKTPAAPLVWDTFENGTVGNIISSVPAVVGQWDSGLGSENVDYTNNVSYAGSMAARHSFSPSAWNASLAKNGTFPVLYFDFKRYYPGANGNASNYKPYRVYGNNDILQLVLTYGCGWQVATMQIENDGYTTDWSPVSLSGKMDGWQHYQVIFEESSVDSNDGTIIYYQNGEIDGFNTTSVKTRATDSHLEQVRIGHYFDVGERDGCDPSDSSVVYTDNVYIDTTWARVEIGNASTYTASTHREIQIPTAWSTTEITATVNQGSFANGSSVYVFVVDSDGAVSSGYGPITVGATTPTASGGSAGSGVTMITSQ